VTISSISEPAKTVTFTPIRWAYFVAMLAETDEEAKQLNRKTRPVAYRKHIGDGYYVSVTTVTGFLCIDLRRFILPYGAESDEEVHPTKSGIVAFGRVVRNEGAHRMCCQQLVSIVSECEALH